MIYTCLYVSIATFCYKDPIDLLNMKYGPGRSNDIHKGHETKLELFEILQIVSNGIRWIPKLG